MEIAPIWRRGRGNYKLLNGLEFTSSADLRRQMVEAGKGDGTAEDCLNQYSSYIDEKQKQLLRQSIGERESCDEGILIVGLLQSVASE